MRPFNKKVSQSHELTKKIVLKPLKNKNFFFNYYIAIKDEISVEDYFHKAYNLKYLTKEEKKDLIIKRNLKYKNFENIIYYRKIEFIKDEGLKSVLKEKSKEIITFIKDKKMIPKETIKVIDFIILKEIQYEERKNKELEKKRKIENHYKKQKNVEKIADRILGNDKEKKNDVDSLKDIIDLGKYLKEEIELEKELDSGNIMNINDLNMEDKKDNNYILSALFNLLNNEGIETVVEKKCKNEKLLNATLQLIASGKITCKKYNVKLDYGNPQENDKIILMPNIRNKFKKEFRQKISNYYNTSEDNILIIDIQRGSILVNFATADNILITDEDMNKVFGKNYIDITEKALFEGCKISEDLLDPKGNNFGDGYEKNNLIRGGEVYDPPYEWHAYGLKVLNNYDNGNNDWIGCNNNDKEWAVAYHGVGGSRGLCGNVFKNVNSIVKNNFSPGKRQAYEEYENIREISRNNGYEICKKGVYLTPKIEEANYYADDDTFNGKRFRMIMMCRVNPKKIREPNRSGLNPYWILNSNQDEIRPYRILIKET